MLPILAIVLTCAASTQVQDCSRETALDVRIIGAVPSLHACCMGGMMASARGDMAEATYAKITCERRREGA